MSPYPDDMSLHEARELFFQRGNLGVDGGYASRWVRVESKPFPFYFPNSRARVAAAKLHDLHHIATNYETDWPGEIEIAAWEIASSCTHYYVAWILNTGGFAVGIFVAPGRLFRAFVRGRRAQTNLYRRGFDESRLKEVTVGSLREQLDLDAAAAKANAKDIGLFLCWAAACVTVWIVAPLLALALAWWVTRGLF